MRQISGGPEPPEFTTWRLSTPGLTYGQLGPPESVLLKQALINEQRGLCAYTGIRVAMDSAHIEHLVPQAHCRPGEDLDYGKMVACYPGPGQVAPFGAIAKKDWPGPQEMTDFVSPRSPGCEARFSFDLDGQVKSATPADRAAQETISRLALNHAALQARRKAAIDETLRSRRGQTGKKSRADARRRLEQLNQAESGAAPLEAFCFALKQALQKHIARLDAIKKGSPLR